MRAGRIVRAGCIQSSMEGEIKHRELDQLQYLAKIKHQFPQQIMSQEDRIRRWGRAP